MKDPTRVAAGKKSRRKGNANELVLAKQFAAWWGHGHWARTPASGGWATESHREGFRTHGDIITTAVDFPFVIECKKQEAWDLDALLHNDGCIVNAWWKQAVMETPTQLTPLLVMSRNRVPQAVMFSPTIVSECVIPFVEKNRVPWKTMRHFVFRPGALTPFGDPADMVIMPLESFFKINPDIFGRKLPPMSETDRPKPEDRPAVPEPVIPTCGTCHKPLTQCPCPDNDLKK